MGAQRGTQYRDQYERRTHGAEEKVAIGIEATVRYCVGGHPRENKEEHEHRHSHAGTPAKVAAVGQQRAALVVFFRQLRRQRHAGRFVEGNACPDEDGGHQQKPEQSLR